ncbi:hypothetical protein N7507_006610 [Penicillium longicatenatum]|nr:hypothetical protein N7507_006610 [Penicillium longicatenatum]
MAAANQTFLQDRVNEIEARGLASEKEKCHRIRLYKWMDDLEWDDEDPETRGSNNAVQIPPQTLVKDLDIPTILKALPPFTPANGVLPPLLHTEQWRQMYLETVQRLCQRQADEIVAEDGEELDGVVDADLRLSDIAPRDKLADPDLLKREQERLQRELEDESTNGFLEPYIDDDLEVRAGFITGVGYSRLYACPSWYSAYVYCRLLTDNDKDEDIQDTANIREWGWRVVVFQAENINPSVLYGRKARFDSIPGFLDWYASWLDHLDERGLLSLQRHAIGCETDCESDCEDHATGIYAD